MLVALALKIEVIMTEFVADDFSKGFKDLLVKVDGLRYAPKMQGQEDNYYLYQCQSCGRIYRRKRRVNTRKFGCGLCRGKLIFLNQS